MAVCETGFNRLKRFPCEDAQPLTENVVDDGRRQTGSGTARSVCVWWVCMCVVKVIGDWDAFKTKGLPSGEAHRSASLCG